MEQTSSLALKEPSTVNPRVRRLGVEEIQRGIRRGPRPLSSYPPEPEIKERLLDRTPEPPTQQQQAQQPQQPQPQPQATPAASLTAQQQAIAQAQMLGTFQAIALVLNSRLVLLIAVLVGAGLGFTAAILNTPLAAMVFLGWNLTSIVPVAVVDYLSRRK